MRARTVIVSLACAAALVLSGCSSAVTGSPQPLGGAAPGTATGATGVPGVPPTGNGGTGSTGEGNGELPSATDDGDAEPTGGLPTDGLPTGLPSGLPGAIPGVSGDCLAVAGLLMSVGMLILAPMLGSTAVTQQQVDQAFAQMGNVPPELQAPMKVLHDAAIQAIGKTPAEAAQILGSDDVNNALDALSKYSDSKCGGS